MKKMTLLSWGAVCIFAGGVTGFAAVFILDKPKSRAEIIGRALGQLVIVAVGFVLVILHFVRGGSKGTKDGD